MNYVALIEPTTSQPLASLMAPGSSARRHAKGLQEDGTLWADGSALQMHTS